MAPESIHRVGEMPPEGLIFGASVAMQTIRAKIRRVAPTSVPVLLQGESGTGKEVLAKSIHLQSYCSTGPFVRINCPAMPAGLLESELFGHERGSFTGAVASKPGLVESAQGGTLFLDEISDLDLSLQSKLLHFLQDGQFYRVGGQQELHSEARVLCATNRSLREGVAGGTFRRDLFYRIEVVTLEIPPLRERREDIPGLVSHFLQQYTEEYHSPAPALSAELMNLLTCHDWPGNIRQLENMIRRYVILRTEDAIRAELTGGLGGPSLADGGSPSSLKRLTQGTVRDIERRVILEVLHAHNWNRKSAARALNISYRSLFYKIKQCGLPPKRAPRPSSPNRPEPEDKP